MKDIFSGNWKQIVGEVKKKWGDLTDQDLEKIAGQKDKLIGSLQERYGWMKDRAELEVNKFMEDNKEEFKQAAEKTNQMIQNFGCELVSCIKDSPLKAVAIAAGLGLFASLLFRR